MKRRVIVLCLIVLISFTVTSALATNIVLTDTNPDTTITTGTTATVYGTGGANHVTIESGANVKLVNFPGSNTITIKSDSSNFTVSRSGATVTFKDSSGTVIKMPATKTSQNIVFDNGSKDLVIKSDDVVLGTQVISLADGNINNTPTILVSGYAVDAPISDADVAVFDFVTGEQIGEAKTRSDGYYEVLIPDTVDAYLISVQNGMMNGQPYKGKLEAVCFKSSTPINECFVTPYTTLKKRRQSAYSDTTVQERLARAENDINAILGLSSDPFLYSQISAELRASLGDGSNLDSWLNSMISDMVDGYLDDTTLQSLFPNRLKRVVEQVTVTVDLPQLEELIKQSEATIEGEDSTINRTLSVVSFGENGSTTSQDGTTATSMGYLSDIAVIENIEYPPAPQADDTDEPVAIQKTRYLSFNRGTWSGRLDIETTVLARLFMNTPTLLFLPPEEQIFAAQIAVSDPQFPFLMSAYEATLTEGFDVGDAFTSILDMVGQNVIESIPQTQIQNAQNIFYWKVNENKKTLLAQMGEESIKAFGSLLNAVTPDVSADAKTATQYTLIPGTFRNITLQQSLTPDKTAYLPNVDIRNNTSIFYAFSKKEDMNKGWWDAFTTPKIIDPLKSGFVSYTTVDGKTNITDVPIDEIVSIYRKNPYCFGSKPEFMNYVAVAGVVLQAFPAIGKGISKTLIQTTSKIFDIKNYLDIFEKNKEKLGFVYNAIKIATKGICDIGLNGFDQEWGTTCSDVLDTIEGIETLFGKITAPVPTYSVEPLTRDYATTAYDLLVETRSIKDIKKLVSYLSPNVINIMSIIFLEKMLTATLGGDFTIKQEYYRVEYTFDIKKVAQHLILRTDNVYLKSYPPLYIKALEKACKRMPIIIAGKGYKKGQLLKALKLQMKLASNLKNVANAYKSLVNAINGSVAPDVSVVKNMFWFIWAQIEDSLAKNAQSIAIDAIIGLTPGIVVHWTSAVNQFGGIAWDYVTKPTLVDFKITKDSSGRMEVNIENGMPPLEHLRYLNITDKGREYVLRVKADLAIGVKRYYNDINAKSLKQVSLSLDNAVNNLLVMPSDYGIISVENQAGFSAKDNPFVRNHFDGLPYNSIAVTTDWHSYQHPTLDASELNYDYPRNMTTAFNSSYFVDTVKKEELDCPDTWNCSDDALYQKVSINSASPVVKDYMTDHNESSMQFIDFSSIYRASGHVGELKHKTPGIYTNSTRMYIGGATYSNGFNVFVVPDYDYSTANAKSHRDTIAASSYKILNDNGVPYAFVISGDRETYPTFNYWDKLKAFSFYAVVQYKSGAMSEPHQIKMNGTPNYISLAQGTNGSPQEVICIFIYDSILNSYLYQTGESLSVVLNAYKERKENGILARPYAILKPDELKEGGQFPTQDGDGDGVIDVFDNWPQHKDYAFDFDNDGMADEWEELHGLDTTIDDSGDLYAGDNSITNLQAFERTLNPVDLSIPKNLTVNRADNGSVTLQWDPVDGNYGYTVYCGSNPNIDPYDPAAYIKQLTVDDPSATIDGLTNGVTYYFGVTTITGAEETGLSDVVSATPLEDTLPSSSSKVPDTGITKCYNDTQEIPCPKEGEDFYGQDGNYSINPMSYTKLDSTAKDLPITATSWVMVRDNVTGLIWENKTDDGSIHDKDNTYTWDTASSIFISELNALKFGGYSDWKLPTMKELVSIADYSTTYPAININYWNIQSSFYWSSDTNANDSNLRWGVDFRYGHNYLYSKDSKFYVRAVRGNTVNSFNDSNNFISNGDGTVTDSSTGLMWQQDYIYFNFDWKKTLSYCDRINIGGYNDWRLPNIKELHSIIDYQRYSPSFNSNIFDVGNYPNLMYYSSSTAIYSGDSIAWGIEFILGNYSRGYKAPYSYNFRAVRGGQ